MTQDPDFSIGIEEEFQVVDLNTRELRSHLEQIFDRRKVLLKERLKPELHQSVVEMSTGVCRNMAEARRDVMETRAAIARLAREQGLALAAAGTHPFSHWADVKITPNPRYEKLIEDFQTVARANLIFGLHVHVGIEDRDLAVGIMNEARYFLPHVLALSVNSPFWLGRDTGWASYRSKFSDKFRPTNTPAHSTPTTDTEELLRIWWRTTATAAPRQSCWVARPHPSSPTMGSRFADTPRRATRRSRSRR